MSGDHENKAVNPRLADGLTHGASRGHTQERYAQLIGMPRGYGYGASMGSWVLDYIANWAGEYSLVTHSKIQYRNPALTGDVTFIDGEVTSIESEPGGTALVTVEILMQNQNDTVMAKGPVEVRLPNEAPAR
jgi:hypothetical protein